MKTILHIITGLNSGGAEIMLYNLLASSTGKNYQHHVVSMIDKGTMGLRIKALGIPVETLNLRPNSISLSAISTLTELTKRIQPNVIQGWMYHANLASSIAGKRTATPVSWSLHTSIIDAKRRKQMTRLIIYFSGFFSKFLANRIICCGNKVYQVHKGIGYDAKIMQTVPNGVNSAKFVPSKAAREEIRTELGLPLDTLLIGMMARFHPLKGHKMFVEAIGHLIQQTQDDVHFLLCGSDVDSSNAQLMEWIDNTGTRDRIHLLGRRDDTHRIHAALDIYALPSLGEGWPLVVGEAMSCGTPCVVTDVGDCAEIVGKTGKVVPPDRPIEFASAMNSLLTLPTEARRLLGIDARNRVVTNYDIDVVATRYAEVWEACSIKSLM